MMRADGSGFSKDAVRAESLKGPKYKDNRADPVGRTPQPQSGVHESCDHERKLVCMSALSIIKVALHRSKREDMEIALHPAFFSYCALSSTTENRLWMGAVRCLN